MPTDAPDLATALPPAAPRRVDLIVYPGFKAVEAIGPMTVFEYANLQLQGRGRPPAYAVQVAATAAGPVASDMAMSLTATRALDVQDLPHTALIVGARHIEAALQAHPGISDWARAAAPQLPRLVALCSGSFFLAQAGLLDAVAATTHWSLAPLLQQRFPTVAVQADAIYLREGRLWTSAGVTAAIDLALALVEEDCGRQIALDVAREMVVYLQRPGGQSQFSVHLASQHTTHPGVQQAQDWILSQLHQPLPLAELASRAAMSERNFRRLFQKEAGVGPAEFIESARLEAARRLLEDGDLPLKTIAGRVGFGSEQALRKLFLRRLGVTPQDYRARFGSRRGPAAAGPQSA